MTDSASQPFSAYAGKVLALGVAGAAANFFVPAIPIAFVVNIICLWMLYGRALELTQAETVGFDPVVAAEAMVAFGVLSLVLGLASVLGRLFLGLGNFEALGSGRVDDVLPFVEGLATAGFAPFFAILLRIRVAESTAAIDLTDPLTSLGHAAAELTRQIAAATTAMQQFGTGAVAAGKTTAGLASTMKTEADRWALALQEGEASVKTFGDTATRSATGVSDFAAASQRLTVATDEASALLEELANLIAAVERFVKPGAAAR